jgi:hypothetical protein
VARRQRSNRATQEEIAAAVDMPQQTVADRIDEFTENGRAAESGIFDNFSPELYTIWNFAKARPWQAWLWPANPDTRLSATG